MRLFFFCVLAIVPISFSVSASEKSDSTKSKFQISGSLSLNTNGIASIPAFSLGKPAIIGTITAQKKRFSYDPVLAYGLDLKPWIIDNWLHYRIIYKPRFELRTGFDFSMFFSEYDAGDYKIVQGQQYLTFEIAGIFKLNPQNTLSVMYWSDNGQGHGTIRGNFYNIMYDRMNMRVGESVLLSLNLQLFYVDYTGEEDGLFIAPKLTSQIDNIPVTLYFQAIQGIVSNMEPFPGFRWNLGAAYVF